MYHAKSKPAPGSHEIERQLRAWQSHNSVDRGQLRVARKKLMRHRRAAKPKVKGAAKAKAKSKGGKGKASGAVPAPPIKVAAVGEV